MARTQHKSDVEGWLDTLDPATTPAKDARHLREIGQALANLEDAERALEKAITDARAAGDSWTAIGAVLGTSRQAAQRKFGSKVTGGNS